MGEGVPIIKFHRPLAMLDSQALVTIRDPEYLVRRMGS
jgi:hypothetical protein